MKEHSKLRAALDQLHELVQISVEPAAKTHAVLRARGLEAAGVAEALGLYLAGALAGAVTADVRLVDRFLGPSAGRSERLGQRVERLVGRDNQFPSSALVGWRDTKRNPWIAEGIGHLLMFMAGERDTRCLAGRVAAVKSMHAQATQQGLDLVAIYEVDRLPVVVVGEGKATKADPSGQLSEAAAFFNAVEAGDRDGDLVGDLMMLEMALDDTMRAQLGEALWKERRTYLPLIVYGKPFDPATTRPALGRLPVELEHRRLVVLELVDFYSFFDGVADAMRAAVGSLEGT